MNANAKGRWWLYLLLTLGVLTVAAPFMWMVLGSLKPTAELRQTPPTWLPENPSLDNYTQLFSRLSFQTYFMNSTIVAIVVTVGNLLFCSMLGYALAKLDFPGKRALFAIVLGTLMIPGVVTFVPLFVMVTKMQLSKTLLGMILPFLAVPFGVFLKLLARVARIASVRRECAGHLHEDESRDRGCSSGDTHSHYAAEPPPGGQRW
jgi:multiple sugar transport system permease protein